MRITANLASRPFTDLRPILRRLRIATGVLALVSIGLGAGLYAFHSKASAIRAREHSLDSDIAGVRHEEQGYQAMVQQPDNSAVLGHSATLNRLFDEKAFSWTLAMEDLETVLPGGVQVTTLEPIRDKKNGQITLHMRVSGPRNKAVELVQNLERSRRFVTPRITGEASESLGNANQAQEPVSPTNRVTFDLLADYNPTAPREHPTQKPSLERVSAKPTQKRPGTRSGAHPAAQPPGNLPPGRPAYTSPAPKTPPPAGGAR
jgi:type IV pilus assembly protein PilN